MIAHQIRRQLERMRAERPLPLTVRLWEGTEIALGERPQVAVTLRGADAARHLLDPSFHTLGSAYVEGLIDVHGPITEVIAVAQQLAAGGARHGRRRTLTGWMTRHSRGSDREAIRYHYDVSNAFYAAFLDPSMVYSCAYYRHAGNDLASAQRDKLDHVCRKLRLAPGMRLLDIGCGWGALVIHAARRYGVQAVGVTLSREQFELATERVREAGLQAQVEIRLQDYRDITGPAEFDRIASIGMFEHVGLGQLGAYFSRIHQWLRPGGLVLNHGITSGDVNSREVGLGAGEFIDRYVFPDGELPHVSLAIREMCAVGLELADAESLRRHYTLTLRAWSQRFEQQFETLAALAGERRARIWRVYLAGCAHAFEQGWINLYQLLAVKPSGDRSHPLPLTRDYMYHDEKPPALLNGD